MTLALRTIPVADPHPVQLVLGLPSAEPIERARISIEVDPEPEAMVVAIEAAA